jgi:uncharacterized protein (DUF1684 family)
MKAFAAAAVLVACGTVWAASESYRAQIEAWRRQREATLKADGGWLTVTGLFWLHEGVNSFGSGSSNEIVLPKDPALKSGAFELDRGKVVMRTKDQTRELRPYSSESPDTVAFGDLTLLLLQRGDHYGIRLKDRNSRFRKEFTGLHYFPPDESYRVTARFVTDPEDVPISTIIGQTEPMHSPGYVEFELRGQRLRLTPVEESPNELSFIFRDLTTGKETYGAGRFLDTPLPIDGKVVLDFNEAYNPPCAFTPYATCPLPPKRNRLPVRIEAGELKYGNH